LNNRIIPQVKRLKYLGIIFDCKLTFKEHINYTAEKCTKLIFSLSKSAKLNWGLSHKALKTIYIGGILPLLLYGAPVWSKAMEKESYKYKLISVQRLINIKMAKAYRTVSNEALCVLTGMAPIDIKIEEAAKLYRLTRGSTKDNEQFDRDTDVKHWQHPAETNIRVTEENYVENSIQIFTDGSKSEKEVGSGIVTLEAGRHIKIPQCRLNIRCTNNQAEQLATLKALEYIENKQTTNKTATICTDSQITVEKIRNSNIHTCIIEEIRRKLIGMKNTGWNITLRWVKAHVGIKGNELADTLAKKAAKDETMIESYKKVPKSVVARELEEESIRKWQREWTQTTKGKAMKDFFPDVAERLKMKINLTQNLTAIVTGHGKTRAYLQRFKIIENAT